MGGYGSGRLWIMGALPGTVTTPPTLTLRHMSNKPDTLADLKVACDSKGGACNGHPTVKARLGTPPPPSLLTRAGRYLCGAAVPLPQGPLPLQRGAGGSVAVCRGGPGSRSGRGDNNIGAAPPLVAVGPVNDGFCWSTGLHGVTWVMQALH